MLVRNLDFQSEPRGFDSRPLHATTKNISRERWDAQGPVKPFLRVAEFDSQARHVESSTTESNLLMG